MAQIEIGTEYRIKEKSTGKFLTVGGTAANTHGEVYGSNKVGEDGSDQQIFTFSDAGNGQFYVKSNSGEYISYQGTGAGWNVNADSDLANAQALTFEEVGVNEFKIKCYNQSKSANKYFKWEYVGASSKYHPFNDADAGAIFIVEKARAQVFAVVYNYQYNGNTVKTVTHEVTEGSSYPSADLGLYAVVYEGTPTSTVTAAGEFAITVTVDEAAYPFEFAATYAEIGNKWYNLIMHSNHNTGNGTERYRTYVGAGNETKLAWGENKTLINAGDDYYWAFVGDPVNGFRVVNKSAEGKILSSNGSANPVLLQEEGLANGYNTTWAINTRKYDVNTDGDFVKKGDWFCLKHTNGQYINANAGNGTVAFWNDNDNGSAIIAVKPLEINAAADIATYFSEAAISIPAELGAEVYYANGINEAGYMGLEQITGIVYPETGIVVRYATDVNVTFAPEIVSPGTATAPQGNLLKGTTKKTLITKESGKAYYALGLVEGEVGFYNAANGENTTEFYNNAFKAYLEMPASSGTAAFYGFDWEGTTGISEVKGESGEVKTIYDLTGRRIEAITAPGIYIVGGKKVLVK